MKPFLKWVGGKTQLLNKINELIPKDFNTYIEPFVGGGAVLFNIKPENFIINDVNSELINLYQVIKNRKYFNDLLNNLKIHQNNHSEEYFYQIRNMDRVSDFNSINKVTRAARMIYLNKSCFNGLYRVNSKGFFNVPSGKKEKVNLYDYDNILQIHQYLQNSNNQLMNIDFEECLKYANKGDFVYLDPPYDNYENKITFTSYDQNNFNKSEQIRLFKVFQELDKKGVKLMLSNHNTEFIHNLYKEYKIFVIY
ncbi:Dam family site-specific DNA-(adenine-N6)-methyltransferase [Mycoplasmopsis felis]|uniref:DNA adenine methylase n=1 Tax=Mycoplasmopsis felis TaxID=33923 RepID=UPI0021DF49F9|nr:Dam family site-specific DNA-(adenine-N6)-methyltransferase [Mycoplasmopsis felis]MCU9938647.1 Dam family site-specific DNA-(adenine-N6)-methyltransferase [Mycoplasmopsis felis]